MTYNIVSTANGGYPYLVGVDVPHVYDTVYPYNVNTWRINGTDNDGYPYTSTEQFPRLWIEPNLNWTFQSNFDIVRDFGRIANNINYLASGFEYVKEDWKYTNNVYKSYVETFADVLNALMDYVGLIYPRILVGDKFDYVVLLDIETVTYKLKSYNITFTPLSLYADDTLHLIDWMVT